MNNPIVVSTRDADAPWIAADLAVLNEAAMDIGLDVDLHLLAAKRTRDQELIGHVPQSYSNRALSTFLTGAPMRIKSTLLILGSGVLMSLLEPIDLTGRPATVVLAQAPPALTQTQLRAPCAQLITTDEIKSLGRKDVLTQVSQDHPGSSVCGWEGPKGSGAGFVVALYRG